MLQLLRKMKNNVTLQLLLPGIEEVFSDIGTLDTDNFTDEPVVQCNLQIVENTSK